MTRRPSCFTRTLAAAAASVLMSGPLMAGDGFVPGDIAFYKSFATNSILTAPLPTSAFTTVGPNTQSLFALAFDNAAITLYAVDSSTRALGTIDQGTGAFTPIAVMAPNPVGTVLGLAFDPTGPNVYLTASDGVTPTLYTIDVATAATTVVGPITGVPAMYDIKVDTSGQMYGYELTSDVLFRIDKATGAPTPVGPSGIDANLIMGLMYDPSDDSLYGCMFLTTPVQHGLIVRFDKASGAATPLTVPFNDALKCAIKVAAPAVAVAPVANAVDAGGNGVFQPNETVTMAPTWRNTGAAAIALTGTVAGFTGPVGPTYAIVDGTANYGTIAPATDQGCGADCYLLTNAASTRPATHWDATVTETVDPSSTTKSWTLHIGDSFTDVPPSNGFYRFVETILHNNVTVGCASTEYCPTASTTREAMAAFVLVASAPGAAPPPQCVAGAEAFTDVPASSGFCRWIEELFRRGAVTGCGATTYCPTAPATREQMAVFVLRTLDPNLQPPPCVAGAEEFDDVPAGSGFCRWIEELFRRGVVTGCSATSYCPAADVTREQMSVFLAVTFGLVLYGV